MVNREEHNLALLCLQYLTFECFDIGLSEAESEDSMQSYLTDGYYVFQDYAALHWIDHLEAWIWSLPASAPEQLDVIGSAINDFYHLYGARGLPKEDISEDMRERYHRIKDSQWFENMMALLISTRKARIEDHLLTAFGSLGNVLKDSRDLLENARDSGFFSNDMLKRLEQYYGQKWNKCPRHSCFYFHEGFLDSSTRDSHVSRHEKPFCCTELSCPRIHLGFSTERELKKHMNINHPDPAAFAWRFPKIKKPPSKYACAVCAKVFTRRHNLNIHALTHRNERPFRCRFCKASFVRKHDKLRHEEKLHPLAKKERSLESSQETAVGSEKDLSEIISFELPKPIDTDSFLPEVATPG